MGAAFATLFGYLTTWLLRTKYLQNFIKMKVNWSLHFISILLVLIQAVMATIGISPMIHSIIFIVLLILNRDLLVPVVQKVLKKN